MFNPKLFFKKNTFSARPRINNVTIKKGRPPKPPSRAPPTRNNQTSFQIAPIKGEQNIPTAAYNQLIGKKPSNLPNNNYHNPLISFLEKNVSIEWGKLKVAISNRQQITVITAWTIRNKESQFRVLKVLKECTTKIQDLKKSLIGLYETYSGFGEELFTEERIKPYIDILSHTLENRYIISLEEIELMGNFKDLLDLIYINYENKETNFKKKPLPTITDTMSIEETQQLDAERNRNISSMLNDINIMSRKYKIEIEHINNDNIPELFNVIKSRLNGTIEEPKNNMTALQRRKQNNMSRRLGIEKRLANEAQRLENEEKRLANQQREKEYTKAKEERAAKLIKDMKGY
jgi:hypothetical protein